MTTQITPRSGSEVIFDTPWLARMIDKARLSAMGIIDEYDLDYPCPMDQRLLAQLKLDGETFRDIVMSEKVDDAIVAKLREQGCL
jgi:Domain of unknown function (DUF5069)